MSRVLSSRMYSRGTGPAVIVIHEMPGLHPGVVDVRARRVVDAGFSVRLPSLFGDAGASRSSVGYASQSIGARLRRPRVRDARARPHEPDHGWLRALAADAHAECGGPGVGAVGMCFTGGFALGMMVDDRMLAPVLSQPSLPFPIATQAQGRGRRSATPTSRGSRSARAERRVRARPALHRGPRGPGGPVRDAAPRARRRVHRGRDRLVEGQPARHPAHRALGADRALRRRARPPDPRRARPGASRSSPSAWHRPRR